MPWIRLALPCLLALLSACQNEVTLDLVLIDDCLDTAILRETQSVRVTLLGRAGFDKNQELTGCQKNSDCYAREQFDTASDFESIQLTLEQEDVLFTTDPGTDRGVVITGYNQAKCKPDLLFCGYQLGAFPDVDAKMYVQIACLGTDVAGLCEGTEYLRDDCD